MSMFLLTSRTVIQILVNVITVDIQEGEEFFCRDGKILSRVKCSSLMWQRECFGHLLPMNEICTCRVWTSMHLIRFVFVSVSLGTPPFPLSFFEILGWLQDPEALSVAVLCSVSVTVWILEFDSERKNIKNAVINPIL